MALPRAYRWLAFAFFLATAVACGEGPSPLLEVLTPAPAPPLAPALPPVRPESVPGIDVPPGFVVYEYAAGLESPTSIALDAQGRLFVAEMRGRVMVVSDGDGDGGGETITEFASGLTPFLLGIAFAPDGTLYASHKGRVSVLPDRDSDGQADAVVDIIEGLPHRLHQNNGLAFGPDGKLYITNGSTCNLCPEEDERSATILRANPDGSDLEVYARGLRNSYDLTFTPGGELWATANEYDLFEKAAPGYTLVPDPPDELNLIVEGGHYGWPDCMGDKVETIEGGCQGKLPPVAEFEPYSSADGIVYYEGENFPEEYGGNFFVAQWGSDPRSPLVTGRKVVRVIVREGGQGSLLPYEGEAEEFARGFRRPLDLTLAPDGTLFVADWEEGRIYRIVWVGD